LLNACPKSDFQSLIDVLRKEIELKHGKSLTLDFSKCKNLQVKRMNTATPNPLQGLPR